MSLRDLLAAMQTAATDVRERAVVGLPPRPLLVGELNPYGRDPIYALFPLPERASGDRLCRTILGLAPVDYLRRFDRQNLCSGKWALPAAREVAGQILATRAGGPLVLLGRKVSAAFRIDFAPNTVRSVVYDGAPRYDVWRGGGWPVVVLNHPSGLCRAWNEPGAVEAARRVLAEAGVDLITKE